MKKILVVHHDQQHQDPLEILLGGSGYQLAFAADETEALTQARQDPPDLIVAEILMPVMDGLALSHEWQHDERLREIPFVFYTATDADARDREFVLTLGTRRFLIEPQDRDEFLGALREILGELPGCSGIAGQQRAEGRKAQQMLQLQAMVLDQIQDHVTVTDLQGRILYVNEAECRLLKRTREQLLGTNVESYGEDSALGATQREIIQQTLTHGQWRGEVVNYSADGTRVVLDCRTYVVHDAAQEAVSLCGIATDMTERKMVEEKMRDQLRELQRWYDVTLGREERVLELKKEVNELLARLGEPLRYLSVADEGPL
jgi:PAS domain S-box-containing protein